MRYLKSFIITLSLLVFLSFNNTTKVTPPSGEIRIFHAGSLAVPVKEVCDSFMKLYPKVKIYCEAAGSKACARKIIDEKKPCDIMISADYKVIDNMLIPAFADWNIKFANNEMAIVYTKKSRYADKINAKNWYEIMLKTDVKIGRADPNADPCGVRAVLVSKLAEKFYKKAGLANQLLKKDLNNIRPKETDLLSLLEVGQIDYIFLYKSVAEQHKLKYVSLPDNINLKNPKFEEFYKTVSLETVGKKPGEKITEIGTAIVYGVTMVKNAPNKSASIQFLEYLLDIKKGLRIIQKNGQYPLLPSSTSTYNKIPEQLKRFAKK